MTLFKQFDELVDLTYATAVDPINYDDFLSAWDEFMLEEIQTKGSKQRKARNDVTIQLHFDRAHKILERLGRARIETSNAIEIVSKYAGEGIIFDFNGRIRAANALARDTLHTEGKCDIRETAFSKEFCVALMNWAQNGSQPYYFGRDTATGSTHSKGYFAVRIALDSNDLSDAPHGETRQRAVFLQSTELRITEHMSDVLQEMFSLTKAEIDIAKQLVDGLNPKQISEQRGASINTIRTQIKSLLEKIGAKSIVDMVRLLCGYSASHSTGQILSDVQQTFSPKSYNRQSIISLPSGRKLSVMEQGDPKGEPILFFHSMLYGVELPSTLTAACKRKGWRIIAPSRPGYGASDPNLKSSGSRLITSTVEDFRHLLQFLGLDKVHVLGHLMGSIFAQRFAIKYPEICQSLSFLNNTPYWRNEFINELPLRQKLIAQTTRYAPFALPFVTRAGVALIDAGRHDRFLEALDHGVQADEKAFRRPDVQVALIKGLDHCVAQGSNAFCQDCKIIIKDWSKESKKLQCDAKIFVGEHQVFPPLRHVEGYTQINPRSKVVQIRGAGTHLLYSHWQHVLRELGESTKAS